MKSLAQFLIAAAVLGCAVLAFGQATNSGDINGIVTDTTGGVLPGVTVTVLDVDKGVSSIFVTNGAGLYDTGSIIPDHYMLTFTKEGFATYKRGPITVEVGMLGINVQMTVGQTTQQIVVTTEAPLLETTTAEVSTTIPSETLTELPQVGNPDWTEFVGLQSGSAGSHGSYLSTPAGATSVGGTAQSPGLYGAVNGSLAFTTALLDGATMSSVMSDNVIMTPSFDSIAEVKVSDSLFSAQYGFGGVIYNQISKGGTDQFHGMAYDYIQNDALNAAPYGFGTHQPVPWIRYDDIGGNIGGPILIPHLSRRAFFFFGYERMISHSIQVGNIGFASVPTGSLQADGTWSGMRGGDFTGMNTIYDPTTQTVDPTTEVVTRQSFASEYGNGNKIPYGMLDSVALALQKYYPEPTPGVGTFVNGVPNNNYYYRLPTNYPEWKYFGRFDVDVTSRNRITGSSAYNGFLTPSLTPVCPAGCFLSDVMNTTDQVSDVWSISPRMTNEFRLGYMEEYDHWTAYSDGMGIPAAVGLLFSKADVFPGISITNEYAFSTNANGFYISSIFDPSDVVSMVLGRHDLHFGTEILVERADSTPSFADINPATLGFTGVYTASTQGTSNTTGSAYADFLLGYAQSWSASIYSEFGGRLKNPQAFAEDDFKVNSRLTLNLGLRWGGTTGWSEVHKDQRTFDPTVTNPATNAPGAMWYASTAANGRTRLQKPVWNLFMPRVGFAYQFEPKTTIRGGWGLYTFPWSNDDYGSGNGLVIGSSGNEADSTNGVAPVVLLDSDGNTNYQGSKGASINSLYLRSPTGAGSYNRQAVSFNLYHTPLVRFQQWNLTVQRQLTSNVMAQMGWVGSHGANELFTTDLNQVPESQLGPNDASARPYPFQTISGYNPVGISNYNSLQVALTQRMSSGLIFDFNYTWSKFLDDQDSSGWHSQTGVLPFQNAYVPSANYGPSNFDVRHALKGQGVYQLPFGRGRRFLNNNAILDETAGGWEFAGTLIAEGGNPFTPTMASNLSYSLSSNGSQYPNLIGNPKSPGASGTVHEWYDVASLASPGAGQFGNMHRNSIYGPGIVEVNASLHKVFPLWKERVKFDLSANATNLFNHPAFQQPDSSIGPGHVGQIANVTVGGRDMELIGKIKF